MTAAARPSPRQRHVLRGLAQDRDKCCLDYDAPTNTAWQHWPLHGTGAPVLGSTFHALLRRGWIEERPEWTAPFGAVVYGISAAGLAAMTTTSRTRDERATGRGARDEGGWDEEAQAERHIG